jgi:hypothetical protein
VGFEAKPGLSGKRRTQSNRMVMERTIEPWDQANLILGRLAYRESSNRSTMTAEELDYFLLFILRSQSEGSFSILGLQVQPGSQRHQ